MVSIMDFTIETLKNTALQFVALFGVFLVGAAALTWLARWTNNAFRQFVFPSFGLYVFGIVGVPIHEFSHAFFCKVFCHEVKAVKWFDPQAKGGAHGAVTHYYSPNNLYHRVGHFFIGLGPVILGPLLLAAAYRLLVPGAEKVFAASMLDWHSLVAAFRGSFFAPANWTSPGFYFFLYLATAILSQLELSSEDLKQARTGAWILLVLLLTINLGLQTVSAPWRSGWHAGAVRAGMNFLTVWGGVVAFATLLSAMSLVLWTLVMSLLNRLCGRELINPFR